MKEYYYLIADAGDGSASVRFFKDRRLAQYELDNNNCDVYYMNEGCVNTIQAVDLSVSFSDVETLLKMCDEE